MHVVTCIVNELKLHNNQVNFKPDVTTCIRDMKCISRNNRCPC